MAKITVPGAVLMRSHLYVLPDQAIPWCRRLDWATFDAVDPVNRSGIASSPPHGSLKVTENISHDVASEMFIPRKRESRSLYIRWGNRWGWKRADQSPKFFIVIPKPKNNLENLVIYGRVDLHRNCFIYVWHLKKIVDFITTRIPVDATDNLWHHGGHIADPGKTIIPFKGARRPLIFDFLCFPDNRKIKRTWRSVKLPDSSVLERLSPEADDAFRVCNRNMSDFSQLHPCCWQRF